MTAYSIGIIVGLAAGIGAPTRVLRAPGEDRPVYGTLYSVHTILVTTAFGMAFFVAAVTIPTWTVMAGLMLALGDTVQNYAQGQMTSLGRLTSANVLVLLHRLVPLCVVVIWYLDVGEVSFPAVTVAFAVPVALGVVAPLRSARAFGVGPIEGLFRSSLGYWAYSGSAVATQLQVPTLTAVATTATAGAFAMATRVVGPITLVTASITVVLVPELARRLHRWKDFEHLYRLLIGVCSGYAAFVVVAAVPMAWVIVDVAGPQYRDAMPVVAGAIVGAGLSACSQGFNAKLLAVGRPGLATAAVLTGAGVSLVMLVVLGARSTGGVGVLAMVPVVSQVVVLVMMITFARGVGDGR
ncbi:hypothetical protein [Gordonia hankookensis]